MGITQHNKGTSNVRLIADLLLMRGNIGKPGAGICPLRGHSNVQGNRTVGISEKPSAAFLDSLQRVMGITPPRHHGHDAVKALEAMIAGRSQSADLPWGQLRRSDAGTTNAPSRRCAALSSAFTSAPSSTAHIS
ncbi:formate dehydrogenase oxidoreductase protein [Klebsiella pneumoniae]|nr:formate dehydrogenase oxidoreductase protein [Klebsiella pneumoniae]